MNYRPYPNVDRALAQLERGRVPEPPSPLLAWIDEAMPLPLKLADWQRAWINTWAGLTPKQTGRSSITAAIVDQAVKAGGHVHVATRDGMRCAGGDDACSVPRKEPKRPIVLARVEQTCSSHPAQWNAWTVSGQYLYLRYRFGIGTVDAFDGPEPETWPHLAEGLVARFEHGGQYAGDMSLAEFCERASLQLANDTEMIGE